MKKMICLIFLMIILSACAPSETSVQTAIARTQAATTAPAKMPLSDIKLESIINQAGDLPPGFSESKISDSGPEFNSDLKKAVRSIYLQFTLENKPGGGISIYLFDNPEYLGQAFDTVSQNFINPKPLEGLGERAVSSSASVASVGGYPPVQSTDLVFQKCTALVIIHFSLEHLENAAKAYGLRIISRLEPFICNRQEN
jgi:hypothetical protein